MATYNKPGVYIQEVLSPNLPVTNISGASVGAFFGITDRGPTATVNGSVVGVPTLVSSWDEFVNTFSFGAAVKTFDASISSSTPNSNFIGTATNDLKYALYSFFSNGGSNAYILRDVNTDAAQASVQVSDTQGTASIDTSANTLTVAVVQSTSITVSSSTGTPFTSATVGNIVYFTGISTGSTNVNSLLASTNSFVISSVTNAKTIVLAYGGGVASTTVTQTTGVVTAVGVSAGNNALKIAAKDHGAWGNNLWVGIKPSQTPYYFDLSVYYGATSSLTASTATASSLDVTKNLVETNVQLSLNPTDDRYFAKVLNSNWITVTDITASSTSPNLVTRVPAFTATTQWSATAANAKAGTVGNFKWSSSSTASPNTPVRLGGWGPTITTTAATYGISGAAQSVTSVTSTTSGGTWTALPSAYFHDYATGVEGGTAVTDPTAALTQFDSVPSQLVINYPNTFDQTSINALTAYAKTRSDSFVVIDPGNYTLTTLLTSVDSMAFNTPNYGAIYFPTITIADPASTVIGATKTISPGGAVVANYCTTDNNQGAFKTPAGVTSNIPGGIPSVTLTNSDFDSVSDALNNINIIRNVPGYGTCVMGGRTIASSYSDKYVAIRRSLNYLEYNLKNLTQFAIFEPNDANLWKDVNGVVSGFLNEYWSKGGLSGATADQAFYVKCDSTINTPSTVSAGELRIEVGVALQRPAEFVVIRIGQINGGTTITTSI